MEKVIERLKASKGKFARHQSTDGRRDGKAWAENVASYRDLVRLAELLANGYLGTLGGALPSAYSEADILAAAIRDTEARRGISRDVFTGYDADKFDEPEYLGAFCDAAVDVWDAVKDKV